MSKKSKAKSESTDGPSYNDVVKAHDELAGHLKEQIKIGELVQSTLCSLSRGESVGPISTEEQHLLSKALAQGAISLDRAKERLEFVDGLFEVTTKLHLAVDTDG